jgi:hypothetical protein
VDLRIDDTKLLKMIEAEFNIESTESKRGVVVLTANELLSDMAEFSRLRQETQGISR